MVSDVPGGGIIYTLLTVINLIFKHEGEEVW